jgi:putative ABC transport system permease protein
MQGSEVVLPFYLAFKEMWHNRTRYLLIGMIVALITTLVLFIAALAEGLGSGNREYIEKLNAELVVYQADVDLSIASSRIGRSKLIEIRRVPGVAAVGQIATSSTTIILPDGAEPLDVSLLGVEPGAPGEPPVLAGQQLGRNRANEVIIDQRVAARTGLKVGDTLTIRSIQGTKEEFFDLLVVGTTDGRGFSLQPTLIVPYLTWDRIRPRGSGDANSGGEFRSNLVAVKLVDPTAWREVAESIDNAVPEVEAVDRKTAYESTPGYSAQQSTRDTQRYFTLFIGVLVVGGFFQIQTLQKVAQIGMLKAIGTSTTAIALSAIAQIVAINALGVAVGAVGSLLLSLSFPPTLPIVFTGDAVTSAVLSLLLIGPLGGVISVWLLLRVEPLTALGLAQ